MTPKNLVAQALIETPLGPLLAAATANGLAGLWFDGQAHHPGTLDAPRDPHNRFIAQAREQLDRYWHDAARFGFTLPLAAWRAGCGKRGWPSTPSSWPP